MIKNLFFLGAFIFSASTMAQNVIFEETFSSTATHQLWTINDLDGDNDTWEFLDDEDAIDAEIPSFTGGFAWSWSWYWIVLTPDNTLTSPVITLPAEGELSLSFKVAAADDDEGLFEEHYAVYVIPANTVFDGTETPVYEETLDGGYFSNAKTVDVDITEFAGQDVKLVFRHYDCEDILYLGLDDVIVSQETLSVSNLDQKKNRIVYQENGKVKINGFDDVQKVKVFDLLGKKVLEVNGTNADVSNLTKGIYIVNFYNNKEVTSRKIVIK
jgi:hypothetical protein